MPKFRYTARTKKGLAKQGTIDAKNEDDLISILQAKDLIVVSFEHAMKTSGRHGSGKRLHTKVTLDDLIIFTRQLTALLGAGITLLRSLEMSTTQVTSQRLHVALMQIKKDVASGSSLKDAIAKHPKIFSRFWVNIVETGEATGQLGTALNQLMEYLEASAAFKRKIISAIMYPAIILIVATIAIMVFIVKIIPMFAGIYSGFGADLPGFTQIVFNIATVVKKYLWLEILAGVGAVVLFKIYRKTGPGRRLTDKFLLDAPLIGPLVRQMEAVRFARGLGMLVKSGTPILHAIDIITESSSSVIIMDVLSEVKENVRAGRAMATPMIDSGVFPEMLSHMVSVGEESGELASILENAANFYQERVDAYVNRLTTLFEPILIIVIGAIVGALIIAMYLPIFGLSSVAGV